MASINTRPMQSEMLSEQLAVKEEHSMMKATSVPGVRNKKAVSV